MGNVTDFSFPGQPMERDRTSPHALKHPVEEFTSLHTSPPNHLPQAIYPNM